MQNATTMLVKSPGNCLISTEILHVMLCHANSTQPKGGSEDTLFLFLGNMTSVFLGIWNSFRSGDHELDLEILE